MSTRKSRRPQPFRICCYQIDPHDDDRPFIRIDRHGPMLNRDESSKIKFEEMPVPKQPVYQLLSKLYERSEGVHKQIIKQLCKKRVNPNVRPDSPDLERDDLQYYVPQLVTFMVLECDLSFGELNTLVLDACMTDFYFAHSVYFYLQSLSCSHQGGQVRLVK